MEPLLFSKAAHHLGISTQFCVDIRSELYFGWGFFLFWLGLFILKLILCLLRIETCWQRVLDSLCAFTESTLHCQLGKQSYYSPAVLGNGVMFFIVITLLNRC